MKRICSFILIAALLIGMLPAIAIPASAATSGTTGDCTWTLNGTELTISGNGAMENYTYISYISSAPWGSSITKVTIADSVTSIGNYAFSDCDGLTTITIPNSVTSIGNYAFSWCDGLTTITIPNSVTSIGAGAFFSCDELTSITIPNSVTSIGEDAFYWCSSLTSVSIGNGVTSIGEDAFCRCSSLTSIDIPDSVVSIGDGAFSSCTALTSVAIGNKVESIGDFAFSGCTALSSFTTASDNANFRSIDGVLFSIDKATLVCVPAGIIGSYTIPDSVASIGKAAFYGCDALTTITIPNSVTSIGNSAFSGCDALTTITIPNSVTSIGNSAFSGCDGLTTVTIPNSVTSIGNYAFSDCVALTTITIPNSVTSIGNSAFSDCDALTTITIPNSVTSIGAGAFYSCDELTTITIPNSVPSIGENAFYRCSSLTSIDIPDSVVSIGNYAFYWCSSLTSVSIGSGVTAIGDYAFSGCDGLTTVTIPNSVTSIGEDAFYRCSSLTSIDIPDSVVSIGNYAFYWCSSLASVSIGSGVTSIGYYAFYRCSSLTSIDIPDSVISIGNYAFYDCDALTSVTIPNSVTSIGKAAFSNCPFLTSITVASDNANFCSIDGVLFSIDKTTLICFPAEKSDSYFIPDGVTAIGDYAFGYCTKLTSVTIPNSITSIGDSAFSDCSGLHDVWYTGSSTDRKGITIGSYNTSLTDATWHYNTCLAESHTYDNACDTSCENCEWVRVPPHDYQVFYNENQHYEKCSLCGNEINFIDHTYDNACDPTCNGGCGAVRIPDVHKVIPLSLTNSTDYPFSLADGVYTSTNKANSSSSTFTITALIDHTLTLEYSVSSEKNYDKLTILKNSSTLDTISGTVSGKVLSIPVQAGDVIKIRYSKDSSASSGRDCASFSVSSMIPADQMPHYCHIPVDCAVCGAVAIPAKDHTYSSVCDTTCEFCEWVREAPHNYQSGYDENQHYEKCSICGDEIHLADHTFDNACDPTCNDGCGYLRTPDVHKVWIAENAISLTNSTDYPFSLADGVYTSTNKAISSSSSTFTITALHDYTLTLEYSVSSEPNYDWLRISKNSTELDAISGSVSGKTISIPMQAGEMVTLVYSKDFRTAGGMDSASFEITSDPSVMVLADAEQAAHFCHVALYCDICGEIAVQAKDHTFTLNGGHTCEECTFSRTPAAPTVEYKDSLVVRLTAIPGFEYSLDGVTWQDSNAFFGLAESQTHTFYQRVKESDMAAKSEISQPLTLSLKAYQETPATPIVVTFTDTTIQLLPVEGCEYSIDGVNWGDSPVFIELSPATKYTVYQRQVETDAAEASGASFVDCTTDKSKQAAPTAAPTLAERTANSITLEAVEGYEYSRDGVRWQTSPTFTNLSCATTYTFYQRVAATATHYASKSGPGADFKTDKGSQKAPAAPTLAKKTHNSVLLKEQSGCEYSYDTIHWQSTPLFTGLSPETNYQFYSRYAENEYYYAGAISKATLIRTNETPECAISGAHLYDGICDEDCNYCGEPRADAHIYANACDSNCDECGKYRTPSAHVYTSVCDPACNVCGWERTSSPHTYLNACDKDCNVCGAIRQVPDHVYANACDAICDICGASRDVPGHVYNNACDIDCNVCGAYRLVNDHIYSNACDTACNVCGDLRDVPDHVYTSHCDTVCNVCGFVRVAQPHIYTDDCDPICNACGETRQVAGHVYSNACDATCNECGATRTPAAHQYSNACDATCNVCNNVRQAAEHIYSYACDDTCNECGATRTPVAHQYSDATDATCNVCGAERTPTLPGAPCNHAYDNACDTDCNNCGYTRIAGHAFGDYQYNNDATGQADGTKTRTCSVCGKQETVTATGTMWANPFGDVKASDYFHTPVLWAVANNITSGTSATAFAPAKTCSRAQIVTFLWRAAGCPAPKGSYNPFQDVHSDQYFYTAVLWAVENGITSGTSATTFSPNNACSRGQIVTFLWRAAGCPTPTGSHNPFRDVHSDQYYYTAVLWAVENGITSGTSATTFNPNSVCTRGQIVTFLYRSKH